MSVSTIEGHLASYVTEGELEIDKLVEKDKVEAIRKAAFENKTISLNTLREILGKEFTYAEIKFAVAHFRQVDHTL
jgi:hypothetical protein